MLVECGFQETLQIKTTYRIRNRNAEKENEMPERISQARGSRELLFQAVKNQVVCFGVVDLTSRTLAVILETAGTSGPGLSISHLCPGVNPQKGYPGSELGKHVVRVLQNVGLQKQLAIGLVR